MGLALLGNVLAMSLVALGIGYIVCALASKEKGILRFMGYVIGTIIVVIAAIILAISIYLNFNISRKMGKVRLGLGGGDKRLQPYTPSQNQTQ